MAHGTLGYTEGSGKNVAVDTIGGADHQIVKIGVGAEGTATDWDGSVTVSGVATAAKQDTGNTSLASIDGKITACNTGAVVVSSSALPTGAATETTVAAVNTVLGSKTDAKSTATDTTSVSAISVLKQISASVQAPPSQAVTNAGTFVTQENGAALTSLQLIDDVVHSGDAAVSKYALIGAVLDDASTGTVTENQANSLRMSSRRALLVEGVASGTSINVNKAQINGSNTSTGNGTSGSGVQRVTLASDSSGCIQSILTNIVPGTGNADLGKAEDAGVTNGATGVFCLAVRRDAPAVSSGTAGDYSEMNISGQGGMWVTPTPSVGGGWTQNSQTSLTNTKTQISSVACNVGGYIIANPNAAFTYIQVWDLASASVTVGTTAPTWTIGVPANGTANMMIAGGGALHATGFTIAATTSPTNSTAPSSNVQTTFFYK